MKRFAQLRYLWAYLTFRNRPVVKRVRAEEGEVVEEVLRLCPRPYRMLCYMAVKELNISLAAIAERGRDVPTAVALAFEDVTSGRPDLPRFWRYINTGDSSADIRAILDKWRRAAKRLY
ncbi:conserved hypothetical protein [Pyrobaculum islandicum DSM 4184]|uniref:Uncharacterized protein n=1 Tax=Pyrobaculum islandicum (strain DSM 4184 / JCM 9189 / GEO3) TaxID=384616 RepID=A1RU60_PYRIL|nr:hypothetical protein [Pyrobaculum islandicum]ABL88492.1 conserved hypothetical protein [Pyrobaculum islandicum DSM 4184]